MLTYMRPKCSRQLIVEKNKRRSSVVLPHLNKSSTFQSAVLQCFVLCSLFICCWMCRSPSLSDAHMLLKSGTTRRHHRVFCCHRVSKQLKYTPLLFFIHTAAKHQAKYRHSAYALLKFAVVIWHLDEFVRLLNSNIPNTDLQNKSRYLLAKRAV